MKNLKKILAVIITMTMMSCGNGKNTTSTNTSNNRTISTTDRNDQNTDINDQNNRMDQNNTARNSQIDIIEDDNDYGFTDYDRTRMGNLYTHLNWTDDQISQYERISHQNMDSWQKSNPNSTLSIQQRMQLEDQTMKGFLDISQYSSYRQWVRANPYKN
ncbi:MAG: hypothetical protein ACSHXF_15060 [Aquaticitalea sp.]